MLAMVWGGQGMKSPNAWFDCELMSASSAGTVQKVSGAGTQHARRLTR